MNGIIRWCIYNPVFVNVLMALWIISGFFYLQSLNRELFPEFSLDRILIQVVFPGASPEEVEEGICIKIEEAITGISGIKNVDSTARESLGAVVVEIEAGKDIYKMKDEIESQVNRISTFPVDAEKPITQDIKLVRQVMFVGVSGDMSEYTLRNLTEEIKDDLIQMPEISQASITGLRNYEISIELSESMLRKYQITSREVGEAIKHNSLDLSGGVLKTKQGEILLRFKGQRYVRKDFEDIIIRTNPDGAHIYLHQIATVKDGFEDTKVRGYLNGKRAAMVSILKTPEEDILKIADRIYQYIAEKQQKLPHGVSLTALSDTSKIVKSRMELLESNGLQGLVLVFLCLAMFLNLRIAFWVSWGIPMSFLGTFVILVLLDQSLNMLSMFALLMALGMIVDDAVVISEGIYSYIYEEKLPPFEAACIATTRVFWPVLASVATTVVAFLPLLCVTGIMGKFIAVIPIAVVCALLVSLAEALIMLPSHLACTLEPLAEKRVTIGDKIRGKISDFVDWGLGWYGKVARMACEYRYATLGLALFSLFLTAGLIQGGVVQFILFPKMDTDFVNAKLVYPEGTSEEKTAETIFYIEDKLKELNEILKKEYRKKEDVVQKIYTVVGQQNATDMTSSSGSNIAQINVELMILEERNIPSELILNRWRDLVGNIPGTTSLRFEATSSGPGGKPIQVQLRSNNSEYLTKASLELKQYLKKYSGVYDIDDDFKAGYKELRISLKPEARNLNLTLYDLATQIRYGFYGNEILRLQRGKFDVKVFLRYPTPERIYLSDLNNLMIRTSAGLEVPISEVATMQITDGYSLIKRKENKRVVNVMADLDESKTNAYEINDDLIKSGFLDGLCQKYRGLTYGFEGQRKETVESLSGLKAAFIIALIGIYTILATIFKSYTQPLIIMLAIPFGITGTVLGHIHLGYPITMMSLFGLVALSGIVVNNSILLIDFINEEMEKDRPMMEALVNSGKKRFRSIFLTSVTTVAGVSTLMFGRSLQAQYLIPMAISLAYGLAFSTVLTLIIVPACFMIMTDILTFLNWLIYGKWVTPKELYGR